MTVHSIGQVQAHSNYQRLQAIGVANAAGIGYIEDSDDSKACACFLTAIQLQDVVELENFRAGVWLDNETVFLSRASLASRTRQPSNQLRLF